MTKTAAYFDFRMSVLNVGLHALGGVVSSVAFFDRDLSEAEAWSLQTWSPGSHSLFPSAFRWGIRMLLLVLTRARSDLPRDLYFPTLRFLPKDAFGAGRAATCTER
eukprot:TRINITY_DN2536_c0_g1_i12.p1 TRINITY_DN2536_c0_g1~~TRINITY_DN2536_c0_g1_i12.p1  ORF type:complete len:106 (+),score=15.17 TRINITY_DN2536_c0_g1_i12:154-471(+)